MQGTAFPQKHDHEENLTSDSLQACLQDFNARPDLSSLLPNSITGYVEIVSTFTVLGSSSAKTLPYISLG